MNDRDRFYRACGAWQRADDLLAVTFKDPSLSLAKYVQQAVCEIYGDHTADAYSVYGFEARCAELVEARDKRLRDKAISLAMLDQNTLKGQMEFDFR